MNYERDGFDILVPNFMKASRKFDEFKKKP